MSHITIVVRQVHSSRLPDKIAAILLLFQRRLTVMLSLDWRMVPSVQSPQTLSHMFLCHTVWQISTKHCSRTQTTLFVFNFQVGCHQFNMELIYTLLKWDHSQTCQTWLASLWIHLWNQHILFLAVLYITRQKHY